MTLTEQIYSNEYKIESYQDELSLGGLDAQERAFAYEQIQYLKEEIEQLETALFNRA